MKRIGRCLILLCATTALSSAAYAQDQGGQGQGGNARGVCRQDIKTFCDNVQPGGGRIIACLREHSHELTGQCGEVIEKLPQGRANRGGSQDDNGGPPPRGDDNGQPPPRDDNGGPPPRGDNGTPPPPPGGGNDGPTPGGPN